MILFDRPAGPQRDRVPQRGVLWEGPAGRPPTTGPPGALEALGRQRIREHFLPSHYPPGILQYRKIGTPQGGIYFGEIMIFLFTPF